MVVPYTKGVSISFKNIYSKHGAQVHFKGSNTIKKSLLVPQDKETITQKSGVIYRHDRVECDEEYIGESARIFGERFKTYLKAPLLSVNILTPQVMTLVWTFSI